MPAAVNRAIALRGLEPNVLCGFGKVSDGIDGTNHTTIDLWRVFVPFQGVANSLVLIHDVFYRGRISRFAPKGHDGTSRLQILDYPCDAGVSGSQRVYQPAEGSDTCGEVGYLDAPSKFEC